MDRKKQPAGGDGGGCVIDVRNLTKDYGFHRGVFDVSIGVRRGEVFGFLGPNGAGKTTTIRHIMGFSKPQEGTIRVEGRDAWTDAARIKRDLGYLPGEPEFPTGMTGTEFIDHMAGLRGVTDRTRTDWLLDYFDLDPSDEIKRMSLGQKRKLAVVTAFMHDPQVLVLDEPTSGLDLLMQDRFIEFIKQEKARGKTVLLSSHIFSEVNATCDRIAIIKDGEIVSTVTTAEFKHADRKTYEIEFETAAERDDFVGRSKLATVYTASKPRQIRVSFDDTRTHRFLKEVGRYDPVFVSEEKFTLEDYFMGFYDRKKSVAEGKEVMVHGTVH